MVLTVKPYSTVVRCNSCLHCIMKKLSVCSGLLFVCSAQQCTNTKKGRGIVIILIHSICILYCPRHIHWKTPDRFHLYVLGVSKELQLMPLLLRHVILLLSGLSLLFVRWRVMASSAPTFQRVDNPASFADSILTRVIK